MGHMARVAIILLVLLTTFGIVWLAQGGGSNLRPGASQTAAPPQGAAWRWRTPPSRDLRHPHATLPTETPSSRRSRAPFLIEFPAAKIAFASDHAGDRKDRIYVYEIQPGKFWLAPLNDIQYQLSKPIPIADFRACSSADR